MSWKIVAKVAAKTLGSAARKLVLLSMADKANDDGSGVYASLRTIAVWADVSRDTAKRIVADFVAEGLLIERGLRPCPHGVTVIYDLALPAIDRLPDAEARMPQATKGAAGKGTGGRAHRVQDAPGAGCTGVTMHRVQDAGSPGAPCTPTGGTMPHNPILNPIQNPLSLSPDGDEGGQESKTTSDKKPKTPTYTEDFEKAWKWWPAKGRARSSKAKSFEAWTEALGVYTLEGVRSAFRAYAKEAQREGGQYVPAMERWLKLNGPISTWIEEAGYRVTPEGVVAARVEDARWDSARKLWVYPDGRTEADERLTRNVITS